VSELSYLTASYKRALGLVVLLNFGFGIVELAGGFVWDSQALKADSLDFVGDGLISLIGLLAFAWRPVWRARSALLQGLFLGTLGLAVLVSTLYRISVPQKPDAGIMGAFGVIGLIVNLTAAYVLLPHRGGDANARAVWLFSRNDALGNIAVVIASVLVAMTNSPWPDLVVALVIASLFLQSAWSTINASRRELAAVAAMSTESSTPHGS
jgi:Co/Zn/Cd efflux system component